MKSFRDYFKIENVIRILSEFNVILGGFYFGQSNYLEANTNGNQGKNQYKKFLNKYYYSYFKKYPDLKQYYSKPDLRLVYQNGKLFIIVDYIGFMSDIISDFKFIGPKERKSFFNRLVTYNPESFCSNLLYFLNLEKENYKKSLQLNSSIIHFQTKESKNIGLISPYEKKINRIISMVKETLPLFVTPINYDELFECFNYDTLCLILGKSILDEEKGAYEHQGNLCKQMHILSHYVNCLNKYRLENRNYFPIIRLNKDKYTISILFDEYKELVKKDTVYTEDYFEDIMSDESFPWEILAPGNKLIQDATQEQNISQEKKCKENDTYESRKMRVIEGFNYLISLNPIKTFKGIGKFEGYIGFEYDNGIVIFEKAYEIDGSVATKNATYVMNRNNFKRLSQLTKTQIMYVLKQSNIGIQRLYHTENMKSWKATVTALVNNSDYTPSDYDYINELIALRKLEQTKIKK